MKVISAANEAVLEILKRFKKTDTHGRMTWYCVELAVDDGVLLFNLLTRELVLLSQEEYERRTELEELWDRWFVVPEQTNEKEFADLVRLVLTSRKQKNGAITGYTIFPTTDCNARCFYCFELGRSRVPMSRETALKVVQYIREHSRGEKVKINWFGGEPLYNLEAIDAICDGLRREGIAFSSNMVSNGYLFDEAAVKKAVDCWNLKQVQITLDGTEEVYNRVKAFVYGEGNPYQIVLKNMEQLLDASVNISVRLNMDLHNADNLLELADELATQFGGRENLSVYAFHLFKENQPMAELYSCEEWQVRGEAMRRLQEKLAQSGLNATEQGIRKSVRVNRCMADSGKDITILPDGSIGLCEHFSETEFVGHIERGDFDAGMVASWKETVPEIPECAQCFYYPDCVMLKKCANGNMCFLQIRQNHLRKTKREMEAEYLKWKRQPLN